MEYSEREEQKSAAWKRYREASSVVEKANAIESVIDAHFWRSLNAYGKRHPGYAVYAAHWLEAQKDRVGEGTSYLLSKDVFDLLRKRYSAPSKPRIPPGMSYWHSPRGMKIALAQKR